MLLVAAALSEELRTGLDLCKSRTRIRAGGGHWTGEYSGRGICFLKTGAGPSRSSKKLNMYLACQRPDKILLIGYAGALAPELRIGDLAILTRSSIFGERPADRRALEEVKVTGNYDLNGCTEFLDLARGAGLRAFCGGGLTSPCVIGDPGQKLILHRRFQALTIDMETAALARVAFGAGIPFACVRAISDEADDEVLAPFSYDPDATTIGRAARVIGAGNWRERFSSWRQNAAKARESLRCFLHYCFETWAKGDSVDSWLHSNQPPTHS